EGPVHRARTNPIEPAAAVGRARRGERGSGNLFGVEPVRTGLGRVLADRQGAGQRLGSEFVAPAAHELPFGPFRLSAAPGLGIRVRLLLRGEIHGSSP